MSRQTRDQIDNFLERKADEHPRLDLRDQVSHLDRLHRFL